MSKLVYILAASHSGSTLLAMLLNAHPELCSVGELKAINLGDVRRYRCSCGDLIRQCLFWRDVSQAMARRGIEFDITNAGTHHDIDGSTYVRRLLRPLHRGPFLEAVRDLALSLSPTWRRRLPEIQRRNVALIESLLEVTGKNILADSSKIGLRLRYLLRSPELDVKVIHLIRDGRAVALTYTDPAQFADASDPNLREGGCGGTRINERLNIAKAATEWRRSNEEAESLLAGLDRSRWTQVRYEDLCTRREVVLDNLSRFLNLDLSRPVQEFRSASHHILGNGMRLDTTSEIRLDERWKRTLTEDDLTTFDRIAGEANRRYGYEFSSKPLAS